MRCRLLATMVAAAWFTGFAAVAQERDPPVRVGRVAALSGTVSFHLADAERWERASLNLPLTDGSALWTQPGASATVGVSGDRIALDGATEFDLDKLDEHALAATQPQGGSYWRLRTLPGGDSMTVRTPRGSVTFAAPGGYEVVSGDTDHSTEITVVEGSAKVTGLPADVSIGPNETLSITGDGTTAPLVPTLRSTVRDAFLQRMLAAERAPARHVALPPAVALMTGSEILGEEGEWSESPDYGPVWYPPAPAGFVPYRDGHWAYVAPWGWTWVDNSAWGFAPSHYGRWAEIGGRWGWVPGREWSPERPPVYAPALVAFVAGAASRSWVGWAPLGPHDAYRPAYHVTPGYAESLNRPTGATTQVTVINRQAVTVVPAQAMVNSVNVAHAFRAAPTLPEASGQAVQFQAPVAPGHATIGATPAVLRQVAPREMAGPPRPAAPGPTLAPAVASPGGIGAALLGATAVGGAASALLHPPASRGALPELRPHGLARSAAPGALAPSGPVVPTAPATPQTLAPGRPQVASPRPERREPAMPAPRVEQPLPAPLRPEPRHLAAPRPAPSPPIHSPAPEAVHPAPRPAPPSRPAAPAPRRRQEEEQQRRHP